jgi:3-keto-5-aminohexanoate cleavage enzyme
MPEATETPVVIQCAVTGSADPDAARRPNLPVTPEAVVAAAVAAWRAGAAVLHLHAREADGTPTQDPDAFARLVDAIEAEGCDAILNLSCGTAGGRAVRDERYACLALRPEMGSLDCGTGQLRRAHLRGRSAVPAAHGGRLPDERRGPELECFDTGHVGLALQLRDEGLLDDPLRVQFVVGIPGTGVPATVAQVEHLRRLLPPDVPWSVCAPGRRQLPLNVYCLIEGGHVRTGLEDNLHLGPGVRATNPALVERIVRLAREIGRPVATPAEARVLLGLRGR